MEVYKRSSLVLILGIGCLLACSAHTANTSPENGGTNIEGGIPATGGETAPLGGTTSTGSTGGLPTDAGGVLGSGGTTLDAGKTSPATGGRVTTSGGTTAATGGRTARTGGTPVATGGRVASTGGIVVPAGGGQRSTETGINHGAGHFLLNAGPPTNFFIGAWTHVQPPMGSGTKGNDYPFSVYCKEGQVSFVSGNFKSAYKYNANIMTFNAKGTYIADYTFLIDSATTEAICRDWVYVGWHLQRNGTSTLVTQYVKYIGSTNLVDKTTTENVPGNWTPTSVTVGSDPVRYGDTSMYTMYARIYAMDTAPTAAQVSAIYSRAQVPDPTAWADWPLINGDPSDVSGNGRTLTIKGTVVPGIVGPTLAP